MHRLRVLLCCAIGTVGFGLLAAPAAHAGSGLEILAVDFDIDTGDICLPAERPCIEITGTNFDQGASMLVTVDGRRRMILSPPVCVLVPPGTFCGAPLGQGIIVMLSSDDDCLTADCLLTVHIGSGQSASYAKIAVDIKPETDPGPINLNNQGESLSPSSAPRASTWPTWTSRP